jgi:hypothetical protein
MKLLRAAVIALFLGSSSASANQGYFGIRLDSSWLFINNGQSQNVSFLQMFGIQAGVDFDSGLGLRAALSSQLVSGLRGSLDAYGRLPILPELSAYLGGGSSFLGEPRVALFVGLHVLVGLEYQLSPLVSVFLEASPGLVLGFSTVGSCFGPPLPEGLPCSSLSPWNVHAAIGLNFRF